MKIRELVISVTNACNSKCHFCRIWRNEQVTEFDNALIRHLPRNLRSITLSGGEPFLRRDLVETTSMIRERCPNSRIVIPTNGFLAEVILEQVQKMLKIKPSIAIRLSIDGLNGVHDRLRGTPGGYDKAVATLNGLKKVGVHDLGITFLCADDNLHQMKSVYDLSRNQGVKFNCLIPHSSEFYFLKKNRKKFDNMELFREQLNLIVGHELRGLSLETLFRAYYHKGIWDYLVNKHRCYDCCAGELFVYIDSIANVYPCMLLNERIGNLKHGTLSEILENERARTVRKLVNQCRNCWLVPTVAPAIKRRPFKAFAWILANKIIAYNGKFRI